MTESLHNLTQRLRGSGVTVIDALPSEATGAGDEIASEQISSAVREALASPLDFPPLSQATIPGDHIAIAVDEAVPQLPAVVVGALQAVVDAGGELELVSIVTADIEAQARIQPALEAAELSAANIVTHDPNDRQALCFVGTMNDGRPLLVSRTIADADLVIPIGCGRGAEVLGTAGVYDSLFPRYCDAGLIAWWRKPRELLPNEQQAWRRRADEAGWLLGVPLVVEVVPSAAGRHGDSPAESGVQQVLAGEPRSVGREVEAACRATWTRAFPRSVSLAVAVIHESGPAVWDDVARAVRAVDPILAADGGLVLCCGQLPTPGRSLARLAADELREIQFELAEDNETDTWAAWQLAAAVERGPVYLLSNLEAEAVEELGMAPVDNFGELARLASRHQECIVLDDSQHVVASVASGTVSATSGAAR